MSSARGSPESASTFPVNAHDLRKRHDAIRRTPLVHRNERDAFHGRLHAKCAVRIVWRMNAATPKQARYTTPLLYAIAGEVGCDVRCVRNFIEARPVSNVVRVNVLRVLRARGLEDLIPAEYAAERVA